MAKRWSDLSPSVRKAILIGGGLDGALRLVALRDLSRREPARVNGSKRAWKLGLVAVNSAGVLPVAYFLRGRRSA
ncbi:hypothetical protein [Nocardioides montaniterrae]